MAKNHASVKYEVKPSPMEMHGDKVKVSINGTIPPKYFWVKAVEVFQPVVKYEGGEKELKPIFLRGLKTKGQGTMISNKEGGKFSYEDEFDYVPEMEECQIVVNPVGYDEKKANGMEIKNNKDASGVAKSVPMGERGMAPGMMVTSTRIDKLHSKVSMLPDKYEKETVIPHTAQIYFLVDTYNLNWKLELNKSDEAKAAIKALDSLFETGMEMKSVNIRAWASPEGEESRNQNLSDNRSKTALKYFNDAYDKVIKAQAKKLKVKPAELKQNIEPSVKSMGEDWDKFVSDLRASNIPERNTIINVISSHRDRKEREQEIRNMTVIYKQIEDNILPPLRRAEILVEFLEPKLADSEIIEFALVQPDTLKLEELLYAATLTEEPEQQLQIYLSATEIYPEDYRAFNNAASLYIQKQMFDEAQPLLETANGLQPGDGAVLNGMGAVAISKNDFDNARENFKNAIATGNAEAAFNMGMLNIKDGDYAKAAGAMGSEKCVYNLALAQMLNGDLAGAKATLNCKDSLMDADDYYLLAVCLARENNKTEMNAALRKAVDEKPALKQQAAKDVEFLLFRDDDEFKSLVR